MYSTPTHCIQYNTYTVHVQLIMLTLFNSKPLVIHVVHKLQNVDMFTIMIVAGVYLSMCTYINKHPPKDIYVHVHKHYCYFAHVHVHKHYCITTLFCTCTCT